MLQILMILSDLIRRYDFELVPGQTIEARPMIILRPKHGIRMNFTNATAPPLSVAQSRSSRDLT
jgi:cytochrome P450